MSDNLNLFGAHKTMVRKQRGQQFIELCVGLIALIPIILACVDFAVMYTGKQTVDAAARDACRAAANGPPTVTEATNRANAILKRTYVPGGLAAQGDLKIAMPPKGIGIKLNNLVDPGPAGGTWGGSVALQAQLTMKLPAAVGSWSKVDIISMPVSFPITYQAQNTLPPPN
jgi:hypothetical protein